MHLTTVNLFPSIVPDVSVAYLYVKTFMCFEYCAHFGSILVTKFGLSKCERNFRLVIV